MSLRVWRFSSIMLSAVAMSAAVGHLLERRAKMRYEPSLYVRLHRTLYPDFGRIGGIAEALAVAMTGGLAWWVRKHHPAAFPFTVTAAGCLGGAHGIFYAFVHPANKTMASWPVHSIPADWTRWRNQWEYTHALRALLMTGAVGALALSALQETADQPLLPAGH